MSGEQSRHCSSRLAELRVAMAVQILRLVTYYSDSRKITGHRFDIFHKDKEKPLAKHTAEHKKDKIEECYELKGINKVFPCPEEN
ncbi:hypothetical protein J6590_039625 [Homalodisca vitripennis]|nr:hypothetical protein J6590_039625 [Homalodisca vitripennis]